MAKMVGWDKIKSKDKKGLFEPFPKKKIEEKKRQDLLEKLAPEITYVF